MSNKTVTLISKDGKNKIVCFKYMEEYFQKEGYVSSKKIQIRLLYFFHKIFNFTIFRKIKTFFALCLKCKFFFKNPEKKEFVFFDSNNLTALEKILPNENYSIVSTRIGEIKEIYITKEIIFFMLKNIFKCSLKQSYLTALIKKIKPKIVVTNCHDSEDFHITSKILHKEIIFIAIQSYAPSMFNTMFSEKAKKNFFIPKFFCYGEYDKIFYEKKKVNIGSYEAVGSVRSSMTYDHLKLKNIKINPNKYDICLISEPLNGTLTGDWSHVKNLYDCTGQVAEFTHRLCKKHNLKIIFPGKRYRSDKHNDRQFHFYKHYLKDYDFEISRADKDKNFNPMTDLSYNSYIKVMESKLVIAVFSTMLREAISFEKKILFFDTTGHPDVAFPGPDIEFPKDSICKLNEPSYELFEERVLKILSMSSEEYFSKIGKDKSFIMAPTVNTTSIIGKRIKEIAEQNTNAEEK
tara:strand:+ start:1903 stop:3288 length:1386 start_codon:yes stop_codon:yes gene_type:complete